MKHKNLGNKFHENNKVSSMTKLDFFFIIYNCCESLRMAAVYFEHYQIINNKTWTERRG